MAVLVRATERTVVVPVIDGRAPWQTRFATLPAAPQNGSRPRIVPHAIPVVGGRLIEGRHLVRAPWAEPLAAFAGVVVETQLVPDAWLRPRSAARRAVETPAPGTVPLRALVAVPVGPGPMAALPTAATTPRTETAPVRSHRQVDGLIAIPVVAPIAVTPLEPAPVPAPTPVARAGRRGFLGRAVMLTLSLVVSLLAFETASRVGRR